MRKALIGSLLLTAVAFGFVATAAADMRVRGSPARIHRVAPVPPPDGDGYFSDFVTGPAGARAAVMDVPGSTTVITRKMMDDFQSRSLCDALRMAPGVTTLGC